MARPMIVLQNTPLGSVERESIAQEKIEAINYYTDPNFRTRFDEMMRTRPQRTNRFLPQTKKPPITHPEYTNPTLPLDTTTYNGSQAPVLKSKQRIWHWLLIITVIIMLIIALIYIIRRRRKSTSNGYM